MQLKGKLEGLVNIMGHNKVLVLGYPRHYTTNVVCCVIWYHLYSLKNVKNTHGRVLILVKLQASLQLY